MACGPYLQELLDSLAESVCESKIEGAKISRKWLINLHIRRSVFFGKNFILLVLQSMGSCRSMFQTRMLYLQGPQAIDTQCNIVFSLGSRSLM